MTVAVIKTSPSRFLYEFKDEDLIGGISILFLFLFQQKRESQSCYYMTKDDFKNVMILYLERKITRKIFNCGKTV